MLILAGDIIKQSWRTYVQQFKKLWPYMLFLFIPNLVLGLTGVASLYLDKYASTGAFVLTNNIIVFAILVAAIIFTLWASMALAKFLGQLITKKPIDGYRESFSATSHLIWPVIYTSLLVALVVLGGTILLIIPGIIFSIWFSFTYYTIVFEEKRGVAALSASKAMVVGRWWAIFWRLFAPGFFYALILMIASYFLSSIEKMFLGGFTYLIVNGIVSSILSVIVSPLTALTTILLYFSAKENPVPVAPVMDVKK